jgi:DNA helicase HerA-like ATPase
MIEKKLNDILSADIFKEGQNEDSFVGHLFYLDYDKANLLVSDAWKQKVGGIPQGAFLLAFYKGEPDVNEVLLLRALGQTKLPTDNDVISSMIDYYKQGDDISGLPGTSAKNKLDDFTRYEFSFSGLECRVLGAFYLTSEEIEEFGADIENFYSANNYRVYKASGRVLKKIVNQRDKHIVPGNENEPQIGLVRYSSSRRFQSTMEYVEVYISPQDFIGKRTALFGMTRTGKSNTIKKIIESVEEISKKAIRKQLDNQTTNFEDFNKLGTPQYPIGQIIFDVNGEYANANSQDRGRAIFELYKEKVIRYSIIDKTQQGFKVLKINFLEELQAGFNLIVNGLNDQQSTYIKSFCTVDLDEPEGYRTQIQERTSDEKHAAIAYDKKIAIYKCCLHEAGFKASSSKQTIKFYGDAQTVNSIVPDLTPHNGLSLDEASRWFKETYEAMSQEEHKDKFEKYKQDRKKEFFDEDMLALLAFLTRKAAPGKQATYSGFRLLRQFQSLHTNLSDTSFEKEIVDSLRKGKIVVIDLSQGEERIRNLYSEKITRRIFSDSMNRFTRTLPNNFIQFYFEEAHNLFPKKEEKNQSDIYNRLAKEGAKLHLGMTYATQEVSSISSNILKNTQNWFIAHLNNEDEIKELRKYYDFSDFTSALLKFSSSNDKGFVRMKTYTNPFIVPVQIDEFRVVHPTNE